MEILFQILFFAYLPAQLALLVVGLMFLIKKPRTRTKTVWGIVFLVACALMLPFTPLMAGLLLMLVTGQGFGA